RSPSPGAGSALLALVLDGVLDVVDGLADGLDLLGLVVGDLDVELLLQLHDQLDDVERVGADVLDEAGVAGDRLLVHREVLADDLDDALLDRHGSTLRRWAPT